MSWYSSTSTYWKRAGSGASTSGKRSKSCARAAAAGRRSRARRARPAGAGSWRRASAARSVFEVGARPRRRRPAARPRSSTGRCASAAAAARGPSGSSAVPPQRLLHHAEAVVLVVDREAAREPEVADRRGAGCARRPSGRCASQSAGGLGSEQLLDALAHLAGGLVGEGDGQDALGRDAAGARSARRCGASARASCRCRRRRARAAAPRWSRPPRAARGSARRAATRPSRRRSSVPRTPGSGDRDGRSPGVTNRGARLLDGDALGEVARLVDVGALQHRDVVGEQLERDHRDQDADRYSPRSGT